MFKIREHGVKLEFNEDFTVYIDPYNPETAAKLIELGKALIDTSKFDVVDKDNLATYTKRLMDEMIVKIEGLLGQGSMKKIFKDMNISLLHIIDLISYIDIQVAKYKEGFMAEYSLDRVKR